MIQRVVISRFFLPLYSGARIAKQTHLRRCEAKLEACKAAYDISRESLTIDTDFGQFVLTYCLFEPKNQTNTHTCIRIGGNIELLEGSIPKVLPLLRHAQEQHKSLRLIQVSLYAITQNEARWMPNKPDQLGAILLKFTEKIAEVKGYQIDSLIAHSFGSVIFEALKPTSKIPSILILDRMMPSVAKAIAHKYPYGVRSFLKIIAKAFHLNANPEAKLLSYLLSHPIEKRKVVVVEVEEDHYFSRKNGISHDFETALSSHGIEAVHLRCDPNAQLLNPFAHHAMPLDLIEPDAVNSPLMEGHPDLAASLVAYLFRDHQASIPS